MSGEMPELVAAPPVFIKRVKKKEREYPAPALPVPLWDTHAHLTSFWSKDPARVLARAAAAGVRGLVTLYDPYADSYSPLGFSEQLAVWVDDADDLLAPDDAWAGGAAPRVGGMAPGELLDNICYLVGVHPYGAPFYTDDIHACVVQALEDPLCVGVGEIGLDYHFDRDDNIEAAPHDVQMSCMARQLELACGRGVPVELHLRNDDGDDARTAHADAYRVLTQVGVPAAGCILHCFGEDRATMERFCELGCHVAYGGAATFKRNEEVRAAFAATPLDRILFETDCPYMAPEPIRGVECEPAMVGLTAEALCRDRAARTGEDPARIMQAAWDNAARIFGR